ncbi:MAG: hypothetical protein Q9M28_01595 [Mariprofundaceae bacterium]|nr:hypothetical protein [Mariprofundaceae bacterium]
MENKHTEATPASAFQAKTKLIDTVCLDQQTPLLAWQDFLSGDSTTFLESTFQKVQALLNHDRWVVMKNDLVYDHKIKACWLGLMRSREDFYYCLRSGESLEEVRQMIQKKYAQEHLDLSTKTELTISLTGITAAPFAIHKGRPAYSKDHLYKKDNKVQGYNCDDSCLKDATTGYAVPLVRLTKNNAFILSHREVFLRWVVLGLIPQALKDDPVYASLVHGYDYEVEDFFEINHITIKNPQDLTFPAQYLTNKLLLEDKERADLKPYNEKILEDIEQGHWSLWQADVPKNNDDLVILLTEKLVARDPSVDINNGVIGIDFGTKSTVVMYQNDSVAIHPMRVGTGELDKKVEAYHYENPTIMAFNDLKRFMHDYDAQALKPQTQWSDINISHTAGNALLGSASITFNTFLDELKQWAGDKNRQLKLIDKNGFSKDLPPFLHLVDEFNPIEIYAYYLGLYINNMYHGIYLNYILSFPVTYEKAIRNKILQSFEHGIKKSLPPQLSNSDVEKLKVEAGASEPAAYAVTALEAFGFEPEGEERVFYGVFDFGGGTTDFDFGIYREANGAKERRYDYAIEHFGAGGDRYLGGENLLELLAFEMFKQNKDALLEASIQFEKHPEKDSFSGSETLLSHSSEARMNTKTLMEALRGFWENHEDKEGSYDNGTLSINLTNIEGVQNAGFEITVDKDVLDSILYQRIQKGVIAFFEQLRLAFNNPDIDLKDIEKINIFLAGNSSKSSILKGIFDEEIQQQQELIKKNTHKEDVYKLFEPLKGNDENLEKPTGKTGVAFGLIRSRKGGKIRVIDHNMEDDIQFKFYLGYSKKGKFQFVIDRDVKYQTWVEFIDATVDQFEIFYTSSAMASTNKLPIEAEDIHKHLIHLEKTDDEAMVYIRVVSPTEIEYVVSKDIESETYLQKTKKISLN